MKAVRLSSKARNFLDRESNYLFDRSPSAASAFLDRISRACRNLSEFPRLGHRTDGFPLPGSLRLVVGDYVLNYDIEADGVVVTAIRHFRQQDPDFPTDDNL